MSKENNPVGFEIGCDIIGHEFWLRIFFRFFLFCLIISFINAIDIFILIFNCLTNVYLVYVHPVRSSYLDIKNLLKRIKKEKSRI